MNIVSIKKKEIFKGEKMSNEESKIIIANDPFKIVIEAVNNLYPGTEAIVQFYPGLKNPGVIQIIDNVPVISISAEFKFNEMVEALSYELTKVITGFNTKNVIEFKKVYDSIFNEYVRISEERFGK